jgi:uncharacterized protein YoxC
MGDILGVAANITGLMSIADIIVRKGFKFVKDVKEAEDSVRKLVAEVNSLSGVLHSLSNIVERLEEDTSATKSSTQIHHIESCYQTLSEIQACFEKAVPTQPLSKLEKLKWPLKASGTKELLLEVERHKTTMSLALNAQEMWVAHSTVAIDLNLHKVHRSTVFEILARQDQLQEGLRSLETAIEIDRRERREVVISSLAVFP